MVIVLVLAAGAGGAWLWWRKQAPPPAPALPDAAAVAAPAPTPAPPPPDAAPPPAVRHPIAPAARARRGPPAPALADADADVYVENALVELLGAKPVRALLNVQGFARAFVATVDNLATPLAPPDVWPAKPTPGAFVTEDRGGVPVIGARNAARYAPLVRLVETTDARGIVDLYMRLYPLFQEAYADLGYPDRAFNDRVVEVIDHLLATPTPTGPVRLRPVATDGGARRSAYAFEDPALESRSAGQKILLRLGPENAGRIKAKLAAVRREIADGAPLRQAGSP